MNPRLTTSRKWTSLPNELSNQIRDVFNENFPQQAQNGSIFVDGRIYAQELLLRVGYLESGRLRQANFEVSLDFDPNKQNALSQIHLAVDCAASMLDEYFRHDQDLSEFPVTWSPVELEKTKAYVQISTVNTELESQADKLLGESSDDLVHTDEDATDAEEKEAVISMLGLGDGDDYPDDEVSSESAQAEKSDKISGDVSSRPVGKTSPKKNKKRQLH